MNSIPNIEGGHVQHNDTSNDEQVHTDQRELPEAQKEVPHLDEVQLSHHQLPEPDQVAARKVVEDP